MSQACNQKDILAASQPFRDALIHWYDRCRRRLPWREAPSLYKTVLSEFMLQQTQVATVLPYFERWLIAFPDFLHLAQASEQEVLKYWEGLGYYTRARNLRKLAMALGSLAQLPRTPDEWKALPGVGPYTAAAIASIAQNYPSAVLDGNVVRILTRLLGDSTLYKDSTHAAKRLATVAEGLLCHKRPGDHNQAMMELGATVCTKQKPKCGVCPVQSFCVASQSGNPQNFPCLEKKQFKDRSVERALCYSQGRLLLEQRSSDAKRLANIYELPLLKELMLKDKATASLLVTKKRGIGLDRIEEKIYQVSENKLCLLQLKKQTHLTWVTLEQLDTLVLSGPHKRWLQELLMSEVCE